MNDREKLIELLGSAESAFYWNSDDKSFVEKIADHLIANGVVISNSETTTQRWIPVTERLTEAGAKALCYLKRGEYWTAVWDDCGDDLWSDGEAWCSNGEVTHWMPLLEPPKGE